MLESKRGTLVLLLPLLLVTAFIYWPGLQGPLILDDAGNLEPIRSLAQQGQLSFTRIMQDRDGWFDRPIAMLSFYANWLISGDDLWSLKLTNLLIHLVCGVLVFVISKTLLARTDRVEKSQVRNLALIIAALWMLTPIQVSSVLYIIQRMAQLATLFSLLGLMCYLFGRTRIEESPTQGYTYILIAFVICWPLATLSKQNGALLPLLIAITEWYFYSNSSITKHVKRVRTGILVCLVVPAATVFFYAVTHPQWIERFYSVRSFTLYERLLTQPRVLIDYAVNILQLPGISVLGFFHDDVVTSVSMLNPLSTLPAILVLFSIPILALMLRKRPQGIVFFGLLFFIAAHLIEASIFPLEMYFEHRNYLASFGLLFSFVVGLHMLGQHLKFPRTFRFLAVTVVLCFAVLSTARAWVWASWDNIVRVAVISHPNSVRAQAGMAITHLQAGDIQKSLPYLKRERELVNPLRDDAVSLKLIIGYCLAGEPVPESAYDSLDSGVAFLDHSTTVSTLRWLTSVIATNRCESWVNANLMIDILQRKSASLSGPGILSHNWELHFYIGQLLSHWKHDLLAYPHFKKAYQYAPDSKVREIRALMGSPPS